MYPIELESQDLAKSWSRAIIIENELNPFSFIHRISLYKTLIDATNEDRYFGPDNANNPLWGLVYQLQWQQVSGRLNTLGDADLIDPDSPWGFGNFNLSVIPYLGAIAAGLIDDVSIAEPKSDSRFKYIFGPNQADRTIPSELAPAVDDWKQVFEAMMAPDKSQDDEPLRLLMWQSHKTSLDVAAANIMQITPKLYSEAEVKFLTGWCRMVDFLAAAAWRTDHNAVVEAGVDILPSRPLEMTDLENNLTHLRETVRDTTRSVIDLSDFSDARFKRGLTKWQRMMRKRSARDRAEEILHTALGGEATLWQRLKLLHLLL